MASADSMLDLQTHSHGIILPVKASAGARRNGILGVRNGALRVAVTAAPEKGKANAAIISILSDALGLSKSSIELLSGDTSPQKRFLLVTDDPATVRDAIRCVLDGV